jgi:hypothetical protein
MKTTLGWVSSKRYSKIEIYLVDGRIIALSSDEELLMAVDSVSIKNNNKFVIFPAIQVSTIECIK